ncbi:MAG: sugar transferase [Candidatus Wallbacteria bacterium]|nr:sugar transferase [Candidatus Wallbacteria bacterium]
MNCPQQTTPVLCPQEAQDGFLHSPGRSKRAYDIAKRAMDLALALPLLVVAIPIIAMAGLMIALISPGPIFYFQNREGLHGRRVRIWKLRTMVADAEQLLEQYLIREPRARSDWEQYMKLHRDPRVIPVLGSFLRRYSIDELPQLFNVAIGEMSLVGPRPFPDYHLERFPAEFRELRKQVLPGITGLWQVTHRSDADLSLQQAADTAYIRSRSVWVDLWILLRTVPTVLSGRGAY